MSSAEIDEVVQSNETRRLEAHRGAWKGASLDRWRSALEAYAPLIRLGNQVAMGTSHASFAAFLKIMAGRIRPLFVDGFLDWVASLPADHRLREPRLQTRLEIVLDGATGKVVRLGVVLTSGVTAYDLGALDAVERASPFGPAPEGIRSPDGRVPKRRRHNRQRGRKTTFKTDR